MRVIHLRHTFEQEAANITIFNTSTEILTHCTFKWGKHLENTQCIYSFFAAPAVIKESKQRVGYDLAQYCFH